MKIDIFIDKLTPCLVEVATGKVLQTTFSLATKDDIAGLEDQGWLFDWADEELLNTNVYKLQLEDDDVIQGLVATEVFRGAVYVSLVESAPHNQLPHKQYEGVGGHLFAIAIKLSMALDFGGYVFFDAKNEDLVQHYSAKFGANLLSTRVHEYRMEIDVDKAMELVEKYTLEGDLHVRR
jgi:hypothetical protein